MVDGVVLEADWFEVGGCGRCLTSKWKDLRDAGTFPKNISFSISKPTSYSQCSEITGTSPDPISVS